MKGIGQLIPNLFMPAMRSEDDIENEFLPQVSENMNDLAIVISLG
eukprot:CAMPEP_0114601946 /NCGR_PEP_ID=MMETSP0125-20121206/24559_1 /TAXON_ID=485358 ORGANISM="Aristerostoma sp., Strain ATCC 50986" /NCGR_SAMPLE_ID=MMETSP0125 /ASSEMBLY_ACC=CAM_ASM_000245 /LENGTH=44 /DNA_ID= /DNA_START= /DNA_END= /DNA_ORIENTATION=